jgi:hypothetical protein
VGINQQRISQITNNANFGNIGNLLAQGHDMDYIARHYHMDLALVWALRLDGKVTHRIECPLSSERLSGNQVQKMQDKRILGTVGRTLLIAKRS